ncbi:MAG: HAD-IC family P-type ATPase [Candidatus Saccharimonadales bacterium]
MPTNKPVATVLADLGTTAHGLSRAAAARRLQRRTVDRSLYRAPFWKARIVLGLLLTALLGTTAWVSFVHGDIIDGIVIIYIIVISIAVFCIQHVAIEYLLRRLQTPTAEKTTVYRDTTPVVIDSHRLVEGDVILLQEGDVVPADVRLISVQSLCVDESLLTGNIIPVAKQSAALRGTIDPVEQTNMVFRQSVVASGSATAVVLAPTTTSILPLISSRQALGDSPLQQKVARFITGSMVFVVSVAVVAFALALTHQIDIGEATRFALAVAISALPTSLPIAIAVIIIAATWRIANHGALVRNLYAIERLSYMTTLVIGKPGFLTANTPRIDTVWSINQSTNLQTAIQQLATKQSNEPLDQALSHYTRDTTVQPVAGSRQTILPFDHQLMMSGVIWQQGNRLTGVIKGSPEAILQRAILTTSEHEQAMMMLHTLSAAGTQVLAIATTPLTTPISSVAELPSKSPLTFLGFVSLSDVLRPEVKQAIATAHTAGITTRLLTGGHPEVAYAIAKRLGLATSREQLRDVRHLIYQNETEHERIIEQARVLARATPEQTYHLLNVLKRHHTVAMTGDRASDAPLLAKADVAISTSHAAAVTKNVSDIVLQTTGMKVLLAAFRESRTLVVNIRRVLYFIITTSASELILLFVAIVIGLPLPLLPIYILWINFVVETALIIPLGLERSEATAMNHPPETPSAPLLDSYMISRTILVSAMIASLALVLYATFETSMGEAYARTIVFCALVVMQWANAINARSQLESIFTRFRSWSTPFAIGLTVAIGLQVLAVFGPLHTWLGIEPVLISDLMVVCFVAFIIPIITVELHKFVGRVFVYSRYHY